MTQWTGKRITKLSLFKEVNTAVFGNVGYEHLVFFFLYVVSIYYCVTTIGDQHYEALANAEERGIDILDEAEKQRYEADVFLTGEKMDPAVAEAIAFRVPSAWLPGFWASIFFGLVVIFHALMMLGQKWSVAFRCFIRFRPVAQVDDATHVHVTPRPHQGKEELVELHKNVSQGDRSFEFHRRKYLYDADSDTFIKVRCRVNYPESHYQRWTGIPNENIHNRLLDLHGPNKFQMKSPAFIDLYIEQITSPFTVFQLFCMLLWCLDDYWQYSIFTLFMICSFEATTVFSRLKSIGTLKGMGNENRSIQVYRFGAWRESTTEELLPGDVFSLKKEKDDVIPCDALILRGGIVVNEASLTGESVPQMKDGMCSSRHHVLYRKEEETEEEENLVNIKGIHKAHALFGGTRVLQVTSAEKREQMENERDDSDDEHTSDGEEKDTKEESNDNALEEDANVKLSGCYSVPPTPDGGCLCYCTRTGFSSSQGKLVRMIENSTATVRGDVRDTVLLLLMLLIFAVSASGYVLVEGMKDPTKSKYQLLLHCILIVTSVVPPELPMQTALAVNSSIMTLMKMQIFCTEPFRVPIAGKVDTCIFDKTGTLTTDELVAVGSVSPSVRLEELIKSHEAALRSLEEVKAKAKKAASDLSTSVSKAPALNPGTEPQAGASLAGNGTSTQGTHVQSAATAGLTPVHLSDSAMTLVLGACHSLVLVDDKVAGDPLEVASLRAIKWELPLKGPADVCRPKPEVSVERPQSVETLDSGRVKLTQVKILARHHFSSKLQRMSVVVKIKGDSGGGFALVKGSPEALSKMCTNCPHDYEKVAGNLAKRGMRVIALGLRRLTGSQEIKQCCDSRSFTEDQLRFVGFIAFTCRVRKDTAECIQNLLYGGMSVIMATGDAMLTAVHVAQEVGITVPTKKGVLILEHEPVENGNGHFFWCDHESGEKSHICFEPNEISVLSRNYDLCVTGAVLMRAREIYPSLSTQMEAFSVFARMRPDEKENVILAMKDAGRVTLMCGDGANDVGALKQSHVGVALLSGFGDLNVTRDNNSSSGESKSKGDSTPTSSLVKSKTSKSGLLTSKMTDKEFKDMCDMRVADIKTRLRLINIEPDDFPEKNDSVQLASLYRDTVDAKAEENHMLKRAKDLKSMSPADRKKYLAKERADQAQKMQEDFKKEYEALLAKGDSWAMFNAMKNSYARSTAEAKKKRGDNSFTGSAGSMAAMMDQMEDMDDLQMPMIKIGDASVASPFTSKMPSIRGTVDIIRQGRCTLVTTLQMYQILALNCLISAYSLSVLHLDGVKYGDRQMTCLGILMSVSFVTVSRSQPLDRLSEVRPMKSVFHPALILSILGQFVLHIFTMHSLVKQGKTYLPEDYKVNVDGEFEPSIVNSIVFLVTAVQQVSVFVVNLKGPPFMGGLTQNTPLLWSLVITFVGTFLCASESIPQLNSGLKLEPFPSVAFRNTVLAYLVVDVCGAMLWDRFLLFLFAFPILKASLASTTKKEVMQVLKVIAIVCVVLYWLSVQDYTEIMAELERQEEESRLAELGLSGDSGSAPTGDYADVAPVVPGGINNMFEL